MWRLCADAFSTMAAMSSVTAVEVRERPSASALLLLATLFLLPLYPKVGLVSISGTYIPIRADDVLIGLLGLVWVASLVASRRVPAVPRLIAGTAALWLAVTLVALVFGTFVLGSIGALSGFAYWAKPIEYLLLGWVCYDLVGTHRLSIRAVLTAVLAAAAIVIGYGVAEHFLLVPRLPGQVIDRGVPTSTIGDSHELAGYLGIIGLLLVGLWHRTTERAWRIALLIGLTLLLATLFWTGARSEYIALGLVFLGLLFWRPSRLPAFFAMVVMALLFASPFIENMLPHAAPTADPGSGSGDVPSLVDSDNVTDRFFGNELLASLKIRFEIKWRDFIDQTARSPIIGLGPSAATEAADGYYVRSYVESGILGLLAFLSLVGAVFISTWRAARGTTGLGRGVAVSMVASTVFVALVSILIDTWIASRVMELYWPLIGTALAAGAVVAVAAEPVVPAPASTAG